MPMTILAALAAQACPARDARSEAGVRAVEDRWVDMLETRNVAGLACLLAPDFADSNWAGQSVPRARILAALPDRPDTRLALSDVAVTLHGDVAIVHGVNRQTDAAGKPAGAVRFTDIFLYRGGRWQAVSAQETPIRESQ